MREVNDWRLTNQERYLNGVMLIWRSYEPTTSENYHDHCEFCAAKFMEVEAPGVKHAGYSTPNGSHWVCKECFDDFVDLFDWRIEPSA
jgi:hypothetical protein